MTEAAAPAKYLIDTAALADLEGLSPLTALKIDATQRQRIWTSIEVLAKQGRIATVHTGREEIKRKIPDILPRLQRLSGFFLPDSALLFKEVGRAITLSPTWQRQLETAKAGRDLVGPYLVAMAILGGYVIVTSELHRKDRPINFKADENLPDVCDLARVRWCYLERFIMDEKLLA